MVPESSYDATEILCRIPPLCRDLPIHAFGPGRVASEFAFVPAAHSTAEDHGWLMGYVINPADETSALAINVAPKVSVVRTFDALVDTEPVKAKAGAPKAKVRRS